MKWLVQTGDVEEVAETGTGTDGELFDVARRAIRRARVAFEGAEARGELEDGEVFKIGTVVEMIRLADDFEEEADLHFFHVSAVMIPCPGCGLPTDLDVVASCEDHGRPPR